MRKPQVFGILVALLSVWNLSVSGQNQLDDRGRKTGPWKGTYPNGRTMYEGTFKEGKPVGEMVRYHTNGSVSARMNYEESGNRCYAIMFYKNRKKAAEGWFDGKQKDSVWIYYSEHDGSERLKEPYQQGKVHGNVKSLYPSGQVAEEVQWKEGAKEGPWYQYYPDGALRLSSGYSKDLMNGEYRVYYPDSTLKVSGIFQENLSHGLWTYFDEDGEEMYSFEFENGIPKDRDGYMKAMGDSTGVFEIGGEPEGAPLEFQQFQ